MCEIVKAEFDDLLIKEVREEVASSMTTGFLT